MHGRERREGEHCRRRTGGQHMPATITSTLAAGDSSLASTVTADSFCKDGRKIRVGDCALFKPEHDSPPFIGIIRVLTLSKDNNLQLGVNWLYRLSELKLSKGILPEAAPNELFYSFHSDETPAASLLHPCKVAFLPKGVELPTGISSFVCRRVYDISNKCLWWLTDQNYIKELQEELEQLLHKTRVEMNATVQPGGRSPKPVTGPIPTSQLKPGSDNVQSSITSFPQVKGKKRERGDQGSESIKRERSIKTEDSDSGLYKAESVLRSEISKITEKGGLIDSEGVEMLVQLMRPDRVDRKMDLSSRSLLASVVAATDKFDCLTRFVQLRGLLVLDGWLQDVHKGRIGVCGNTKDGDKLVEEFLLVLLRALDKIPVNLQALQMCNIGKSVNHLRQHKNMEIQKKARCLVDTWKKRVEAEMNMIDAKSGSNQAVAWPSKSRLPEASHSGNKTPSGSNDVTKSAVSQLYAYKTASVNPSQGETTTKSASLSPGPIKVATSPASGKEGQLRVLVGGQCDVPLAREDKSSSSSQSHNHSQSSGKEDARTSTAVSMRSIKTSSGSSRHRKSSNGYPGSSISGGQKENATTRNSSMHRNPTPEKLHLSALNGEKAVDVPVVEGSGHKLIVKISNRGRSPALSANGGSHEDPTIMSSRASSPVLSGKNDQFDRNSKEKSDAYRSNVTFDVIAESWQSNGLKDVLTGSEEGDGSPAAVPEEERSITVAEGRISGEAINAATSSSGTELKSGKLHKTSFSSMNALIESCVQYSEANTSMSLGDAVGMNLLASVATEEMSKSDMISPSVYLQRNDHATEPATCKVDDIKSESLPMDTAASGCGEQNNDVDFVKEKPVVSSTSSSVDKLHPSESAATELSIDRKPSSSPFEEAVTRECNNDLHSSCMYSQPAGDSKSEMNEKSGEMEKSAPSPCVVAEEASDTELSKQLQEEKIVSNNRFVDAVIQGGNGCSVSEDKVANTLVSIEDSTRQVKISVFGFESDNKNDTNSLLNAASTELKPVVAKSESTERNDKEGMQAAGSCTDIVDEGGRFEMPKSDQEAVDTSVLEDKALVENDLSSRNQQEGETSVEKKDFPVHDSGGSLTPKERPGFSNAEGEKHLESRVSEFFGVKADRRKDCASTMGEVPSISVAAPPNSASKLKFDLNEGFISDEGKYGEPINLTGPGCSSSVQILNPLPFAVSSVSSSLPASITVAAAAKGPFVPPEELLRVKGEFGWRGSAATSAFRPAEPRKVIDMPLASMNLSHSEISTIKHGRPPLDIDLNVSDDHSFEDINPQDSALEIRSTVGHTTNQGASKNELTDSFAFRNSGGFQLDLNRVDEPNGIGQCSVSSSHRLDGAILPAKPSSSSGIPTGEMRRDFDLNNRPGVDDSSAEQSPFQQNHRGSMRFPIPASSLRMNNQEIGNFCSWFPPGNTYSTVTIPSMLPDRGEQPPFPLIPPGGPQIMGSPAAGSPFTQDVYGSSILSSSPAVPFPSAPFQYPIFPFGTTFPLPSATFSVGSTSYIDSSSGGRFFTPPMNSQLLGPVGAVSSQYPRPYVVGLPDSSSNGVSDHSRKWGRQGLDLNAGPGVVDMEGREESVSLASRQLSVAGPQALVEEHSRMYPVAGGVMKRKEPEGGWDSESFRFKQSSWQ